MSLCSNKHIKKGLIGTAPTITLHPVSQIATPYSTVTFTVAASAVGTSPMSYQWRANNSDINGATSSSFTLTKISYPYDYNGKVLTCRVTNAFGTTTSNGALLTHRGWFPVNEVVRLPYNYGDNPNLFFCTNLGSIVYYKYNSYIASILTTDSLGTGYGLATNYTDNVLFAGAPNENYVKAYYATSTTTFVPSGSNLSGVAVGDLFGTSIASNANGTRIVVGAPGGNSNRGYVGVYSFNGGLWSQLGGYINGSTAGDRFGTVVAMNSAGSTIVVGTSSNSVGYARAYSFDGSSWTQLGQELSGTNPGDNFGVTVSTNLLGNIITVGASNALYDGVNRGGQVSVYKYNTSTWTLTANYGSYPGVNAPNVYHAQLNGSGNTILRYNYPSFSALYVDTLSGTNSLGYTSGPISAVLEQFFYGPNGVNAGASLANAVIDKAGNNIWAIGTTNAPNGGYNRSIFQYTYLSA